jgi:hypothetical protein
VDTDKIITAWKPEVDSSQSTIKLELSKFNTFFVHEGKTLDTSSPGVLMGGGGVGLRLLFTRVCCRWP